MRVQISYALVLMAISACNQTENTVQKSEANAALQIALTGVSRSGDTYRLRDAVFEISGCSESSPGYPYYPYAGVGGSTVDASNPECTSTSVSTEDDVNASTITKRLLPGYYSINLRTGWRMEQNTSSDWTNVDQAVLLSPALQQQYVWDRGVVPVYYSFGVDGERIDFRYGDLSIMISIERPGDPSGGTAGYPGFGYGGSPSGAGSFAENGGSESAGTGGSE